MENKQMPDISFSDRAEVYIVRFMRAARATGPEAAKYIPIICWALGTKFTSRATGETTFKGAEFDVGAIGRSYLRDEVIARLKNGLDVAVRLPDDLKSADHLHFDYIDGQLCLPGRPGYDILPRPYDPKDHQWPKTYQRVDKPRA